MILRPGTLVGRNKIERLVGQGMTANVYAAFDDTLDRRVAVKHLTREVLAAIPTARWRTLLEGRLLASVECPQIIKIYDLIEDRRGLFLILEYLEGARTLKQLVTEGGPLQLGKARDVGLQLASGLAALKRLHIAIRDLKPDNGLIGDGGTVKLIDFGFGKDAESARATVTVVGTLVGTLVTMAPEQCRFGLYDEPIRVDERCDMYAFAATLHYLLTGHYPFEDEAPMKLIKRILQDRPPPVSALRPGAAPFDPLIAGGLEKDAAARWTPDRAIDFLARLELPEWRPRARSQPHDPDTTIVEDSPAERASPEAAALVPAAVAAGAVPPPVPPPPHRRRLSWLGARGRLVAAVGGISLFVLVAIPVLALIIVQNRGARAGEGEEAPPTIDAGAVSPRDTTAAPVQLDPAPTPPDSASTVAIAPATLHSRPEGAGVWSSKHRIAKTPWRVPPSYRGTVYLTHVGCQPTSVNIDGAQSDPWIVTLRTLSDKAR